MAQLSVLSAGAHISRFRRQVDLLLIRRLGLAMYESVDDQQYEFSVFKSIRNEAASYGHATLKAVASVRCRDELICVLCPARTHSVSCPLRSVGKSRELVLLSRLIALSSPPSSPSGIC